jgi:hypothetical protein
MWIVDVPSYGELLVARADEKLTAFVKLGRYTSRNEVDVEPLTAFGSPPEFGTSVCRMMTYIIYH